MSIKRYDRDGFARGEDNYDGMVLNQSGSWLHYEDHVAELTEARATIERLKIDVAHWRESSGVAQQLCLEREAENAALLADAERVKDRIAYPRDMFNALIAGNSPYAFYIFQWVPYQADAQRWRLKMLHDVRTFDGREAMGIWPNANNCGPFKDDEVEFIRISKNQHGIAWEDPRPARAAQAGEG
jgi:hypothetical protein